MNLKPAMAAPLPWLTFIAGFFFARTRKTGSAARQKNLLRLPRSLKVTTEGKWYIGILLLIGVAAINTGNNLLYLVVATMLSIIIISGVLSESSIRSVRVRRELPAHIYKGQTAMVRLRLSNRKSLFPSFSLFTSEAEVDGVSSERTYTLKLRPLREAVKTSRYTFASRGLVELSGIRVSGPLECATRRCSFGITKPRASRLVWRILRCNSNNLIGVNRPRAITLDLTSGGGLSAQLVPPAAHSSCFTGRLDNDSVCCIAI